MTAAPSVMQVDDLHMAFKRPRSVLDRLAGRPMQSASTFTTSGRKAGSLRRCAGTGRSVRGRR